MPNSDLANILEHFHALIRKVSQGLSDEHGVALPTEKDMLAAIQKDQWLPIPGMAGGFSYKLSTDHHVLTVESWCRIVEGSGMRHEVTPVGSTLVEEGFV